MHLALTINYRFQEIQFGNFCEGGLAMWSAPVKRVIFLTAEVFRFELFRAFSHAFFLAGFFWDLLGFDGIGWDLPGFAGICWDLLGFAGF